MISGDDLADDLSPQTAFAMITKANQVLEAQSAAQRAGSAIYVLPGVYDEGPRGVSLRTEGFPGIRSP